MEGSGKGDYELAELLIQKATDFVIKHKKLVIEKQFNCLVKKPYKISSFFILPTA